MKTHLLPVAIGVLIAWTSGLGWAIEADTIVPGSPSPTLNAPPPKDAVVLFDGKDQNAWASQMNRVWEEVDGPADWKITPEGWLEVVPGAGSLISKQRWGDFQLHLEFRLPPSDINGGVFLMSRYELGISSSSDSGSHCGGFDNLKQKLNPSERADRRTNEWQTMDVDFRAPRFDAAGKVVEQARATVKFNGVTIHDDVELGPRKGAAKRLGDAATGPLMLQEHGSSPLVPKHLARGSLCLRKLSFARHRMCRTMLALAAWFLFVGTGQAGDSQHDRLDNWHQWRGPDADGFAPHADPPLHWDESTNIEWTADIPGTGSVYSDCLGQSHVYIFCD